MAPITRTATFATSDPPAEALERCRAWMAQRASARVDFQTAVRLELTSGSQVKLRLIGGRFVAASSLPVRTVVDAVPTATGSELTVTATDAVGFGPRTGMKGMYQRWLDEIVSGLRAAAV
jgi:hypothetical protein